MVRSNVEKIKALFSSLLVKVQSALQSQSDISNITQFLITFFKCDFPETSDVKKLFTTITLNDLWDYQHYSPLEQLIDHFLPGDQELEGLMKAYKARLSGFYLTTKLIDYIEYRNLPVNDSDEECDQPSPKLTTKEYRKIKVVLQLERKISQVSLDYVVKLWQSFVEEYEIPSLTAVIDRIVTGSIEISWLIPTHVAEVIKPRSKFFRKHHIVLVFIDDVILYDEKEIAEHEQHFLLLCQRADSADVVRFTYFLEKGVGPDIFDEHGLHPLLYASYHNRADLVQLLLQYHATVDMRTKDDRMIGDTALITAVNQGHLHVAEILVKNGANVNYRDIVRELIPLTQYGQSVLWKASYHGHTEIVLLLLRHHALVDLPTDDDIGETPLVAAVNNGHLRVAEILVKNGANVNYRNKKGESVLWKASYYGHTEIVLLLLRHHASVDLPTDDDNPETPLFAACSQGRYDPAAVLISNGADVNYLSKTGKTAMYFAAKHNYLQLVELLLSDGGDINKGVQSPLYVACDAGNMEMVQLLVHHQAAIDQLCDDECAATPLITASVENHIEVARFLVGHGAGINLPNKKGNSPLQVACIYGNTDIVKLLIQSNADIELQNKEGRTGLMIAAWRGHLLTVMELVRAGAKTDPQDQAGLTSLILAVQNQHVEVVEALLNAHCNPNITENTVGWSALHFATKSANVRITKLLLQKGADTELRDKNGLTLLEICEDEAVCDELRRHTISQTTLTNTQPTEEYVEKQDSGEITEASQTGDNRQDSEPTGGSSQNKPHSEKHKVTEEQRKKVKKSYQKLLRIFDFLEDSLLPGRKQKRLHQQREASNIAEANQQLFQND